MEVIHFLLGPIVGCIIGAFTNFIAIKMLFRPLKPVKIGRFTLPFTPGIIPKHQEALAKSLSETVYKNLFSTNDIEDIFMSDGMIETFTNEIYNSLGFESTSDGLKTLEKIKALLGEEKSAELKLNLQAAIYNRIHLAIQNTNISNMVTDEAKRIIKEKTQGALIAEKFMNDSLIANLSEYMGFSVDKYIKEHDVDIIAPLLNGRAFNSEMAVFTLRLTPNELAKDLELDREAVKLLIKGGYVDFMKKAKQQIAESFHIKEFIHDRIMELNPADIERLVNLAIKREMNYLVYLGGLLGLVIGLINSFF